MTLDEARLAELQREQLRLLRSGKRTLEDLDWFNQVSREDLDVQVALFELKIEEAPEADAAASDEFALSLDSAGSVVVPEKPVRYRYSTHRRRRRWWLLWLR